MKIAIADPPYFGRAHRWYGAGRGHAGGHGRADIHLNASDWDLPETHQSLVAELERECDGWAIAMAPDSLPLYLAVAPPAARVAVWARGNAIPSGSRVRAVWEPVLIKIPPQRSPHGAGPAVDDVLTVGIDAGGFAGRKPAAWTHWVLGMLGYRPADDELVDLFPGSGAVTRAAETYAAPSVGGRQRKAPPGPAQQVRRTARAASGRKAAVLAALRAGGSIRSVAAEARVSTSTVQRWKKEAGYAHEKP